MSRRDNADARCPRCRPHASLYLCSLIPRLETRTRLVLVIQRREDRKPTNTGRLATECLPNSEVIVRGDAESHRDAPRVPTAWSATAQPLLKADRNVRGESPLMCPQIRSPGSQAS